MNALTLQLPGPALLPGYVAALQAGWSPSAVRDLSGEHLAAIQADAPGFLRGLQEHEGQTVPLPGGGAAPRLPGRVLWMWDGAFCGSINLRHMPGTTGLPPHVSGHVGYAVVPWRRRLGYATRALALMLPVARGFGLPRVLLTCDGDNEGSRRAILANGGVPDGAEPNAGRPGVDKLRFWVRTSPLPREGGS